MGATKLPPDDELRHLAGSLTPVQIAEQYGVTRNAVYDRMDRAGIERQSRTLLTHKTFLPWKLHPDHSQHSVRYALMAWSTEVQGGELSRIERSRLNNLRRHLERVDRVVAYTREEGFTLVHRDPAVDDPDLPIRRPPPP